MQTNEKKEKKDSVTKKGCECEMRRSRVNKWMMRILGREGEVNLVRESVRAAGGVDVSGRNRTASLDSRLLSLSLEKHSEAREHISKHLVTCSFTSADMMITCSSILSCLSRAASTASKNSSSLMRLFGPSCR